MKISNAPLSRVLLEINNQNMITTPQTGLLGMNKSGSLVPMATNDANIEKAPVVGIWVTNLPFDDQALADPNLSIENREVIKMNTLKTPTVWASLVRLLLCTKKFKMHINNANGDGETTFLILN